MFLIYSIFVAIIPYINTEVLEGVPDAVKNGTLLSASQHFNIIESAEYIYLVPNTSEGNWFEAAQYCRLFNTHLVSLNTAEENDVLGALLQIHFHPNDKSKLSFYWTSGVHSSSKWIWTGSGQSITYDRWGNSKRLGSFYEIETYDEPPSGPSKPSDDKPPSGPSKPSEPSDGNKKCLLGQHYEAEFTWLNECCSTFKGVPICQVSNDANINGKTALRVLYIKDLSNLVVILSGLVVSMGVTCTLGNIIEILLEYVNYSSNE